MNIVVNAQANTISGGGKAETIYGEAGNDKILGGAGFVYGSGDGKDVITNAADLRETFRDSCSESSIGDLSVSSDIVNLTAELATAAPIFRATEKNQ